MNSGVKNVIIFMSGLAVGAVGTYLGLKTYFEAKADAEIEETKEMYHARLEELAIETAKSYGSSIEDPEIQPSARLENEPKQVNGLEDTVSSLSEGPGAKQPDTDYTSYFKKGEEKLKSMGVKLKGGENMASDEKIDPSELEGPEDDEEMDDEEDELQQEDYEMYLVNEEHQEAVREGRLPYLIDATDFGKIPGYETMDLYYYASDNVLADEDKDEVDAPEIFVGDILDNGYTFDEESIFIRSDVTMTDVEVHRLDAKFYSE